MLTLAQPDEDEAVTAGIEASFVEYVRALRRQLPGPYLWMAKALATGRVYWIGEWQGVVMHAQVHPLYMVDSIGILPQAQGNSRGTKSISLLYIRGSVTT